MIFVVCSPIAQLVERAAVIKRGMKGSDSWPRRTPGRMAKDELLCANCHREVHAEVAAPDGNIRMKNRVNSGKPDSADAEMVILSQACSDRSD